MNKRQYSLVSITNMPINGFTNLPKVCVIQDVKFKISLDEYGTTDKELIITPSQFKGVIPN